MTVCYWCGAKDTLADIGKELDDGKYIMVKCKKCKTAYYVENKEKMMEKVQMTNEEWFDSLTTEEKAKVFANATYSTAVAPMEILVCGKKFEQKKWEMWLKAVHKE